MAAFQCASTQVEAPFTTSKGRSACFVSGGSGADVRYWSNGVFYKLYMLPPFPPAKVADAQVVLGSVLDSLN
jgi:hypothetical protein